MTPIRLRRNEIVRLAGEACLDARTVEAVLRGEGREGSQNAVIEAAKRLGLALPAIPEAKR